MAKRFHVKAITRDKEYDLGKGSKGSKVHYFSANPNGEAELVSIQLSPGSKAKKKVFDFDFASLAIKGRASQGNIVTKYPVRKITLKEAGKSTLGAQKIWMDDVSGRLNKVGRGIYLGAFDTGDQILAIYKNGHYEITELQLTNKYDASTVMYIGKFIPELPVNIVYFEGDKGWTMVKRFVIETSTVGSKFKFITEHRNSKVYYAGVKESAKLLYGYKSKGQKVEKTLDIDNHVEVKGWKALGNKLMEFKIISSKELEGKLPTALIDDSTSEVFDLPDEAATKAKEEKVQSKLFEEDATPKTKTGGRKPKAKPVAKKSVKKPAAKKPSPKKSNKKNNGDLKAGDTIEFDL